MLASALQMLFFAAETDGYGTLSVGDGYAIGDVIVFGTVPDFSDYGLKEDGGDAVIPPGAVTNYVNDAGTNNGAAGLPLKWQIVDIVDGDKVVLLCTEIVSNMWNITNFALGRENTVDTFWANSNLRKFLNGGVHDFVFVYPDEYWIPGCESGYSLNHKGGVLGKAFTEEQQDLLLAFNYSGIADMNGVTGDKVVAPSVAELEKWAVRAGANVKMTANLVGHAYDNMWYTRTPSEARPNNNMFLVADGFVIEHRYNGQLDGYVANLGVRPAIMLPLDYFEDGVSGYSAGDTIVFGRVPDYSDYLPGGGAYTPVHPGFADNPLNTGAANLPLEWQIVDVKGDNVVLLCKSVLCNSWNLTNYSHYRNNTAETFWANSNLRKFLNGGEYTFTDVGWLLPASDWFAVDHKGGIADKAFNEEEKALLRDYTYANATGLNGTTDKVALPSADEVEKWGNIDGVDLRARLIGPNTASGWYTRTPGANINSSSYQVDTFGALFEGPFNGMDGYQRDKGPRPVIMLPLSYFKGGVYIKDYEGGGDDAEIEYGFASEYDWDGFATDGSGRMMKDDPRVVIFDDFSDYNGVRTTHIPNENGWNSFVPRRWIATGNVPTELDANEKFSGDYSIKFPARANTSVEQAAGLQMWVDTRGLRGDRMNEEPMSAVGNYRPNTANGMMTLTTNVNHREGGFEELYGRFMVKYADNFNFSQNAHNGMGFSGGYTNRPDGGGTTITPPPGTPPGGHPGSQAGYRSNGYDRWMAGLEPEHGELNIYYYGAEQVGATGNHMYSTGEVVPSTGGDNTRPVNRIDGVNDFTALPSYRPKAGVWNCVELHVKLNTVHSNGTSNPPNSWWAQYPLGPAAAPPDCSYEADGELTVWVDGQVVLKYTDVVFRYTDTMIIDIFSFSLYFHSNTGNNEATCVWYDNVVVATEYIGPVNTENEQNTNSAVVSYDANGGTGSMSNVVVTLGDDHIVKPNGFENEGFDFVGWNTQSDGSGEAYAAGATIPGVQSDIKLYAQWKPSSGTVGSEVEFGSYGGVPMEWVIMSDNGDSYTLLNKYVLETRQFHAWTTLPEVPWIGSPLESYLNGGFYAANFTEDEKDSIVSYDGRANNFVTIPSGDEVLGWWGGLPTSKGIVGRQVTFPNGAGSDGEPYAHWWLRVEPVMPTDGNSNSRADNCVEFRWNANGEFGRHQVHSTSAVRPLIKVDKVFFDGAPTFNIIYNANGGTGVMAMDVVEQGADYTIKANAFTRHSYTFTGWNTAADGSGTAYAAGGEIIGVSANVTLFAMWRENDKLPEGTLEFGTFGGEPIEWIYVDQDESSYTLISKYLLERRQFHSNNGSRASWIGTDIYNYLNSSFYLDSFNPEERSMIKSYDGSANYFVHLASKAEATAWFATNTLRIGYMRPGVHPPYPVAWFTSSIASDVLMGNDPRDWCHWRVENAMWGMQFAGDFGFTNNDSFNASGQGGNTNLGSGVGVDAAYDGGVRPVIKIAKSADTGATLTVVPASASVEQGASRQFAVTGLPSAPILPRPGIPGATVPGSITVAWGDSLRVPVNGEWGNAFDLGANFTPGSALIFYYTSDNDLDYIKDHIRFVVMGGFGGDWGSNQVAIDWNAGGSFFQIHYDDFAAFIGTDDFTTAGIGPMQLLVINGGAGDMSEPFIVTSAQIGAAIVTVPVSVDWSVSGGASAATAIDASGLLTVAEDESAAELTVKAEVAGDPSVFGTAAVTVVKKYEPPSEGFAANYLWDGFAADGSGQKMKDDPRIIIMDNFSDYENGRLKDHAKGGGDITPRRWIGKGFTSLTSNESFTGNYSVQIDAPPGTTGGGISQWIDSRALRGERMNDEPYTASGKNVAGIPDGGIPTYDVNHKEGGYEEVYFRAMVKYSEGWELYAHNGIHIEGGNTCRPNPGRGGGPSNPGSSAGYRSNGYDILVLGLEPEYTSKIPGVGRPGALNVYYYGPEQLGANGNHMFGNGLVYGSTGNDNNHSLSRTDGVNGFVSHEPERVPVGEWYCMEYHIKLNTVIDPGTSPKPNQWPQAPLNGDNGPQPQPDDCIIERDGVLEAWVNGVKVMEYNDVVFRYTDTVILDFLDITTYIHGNTTPNTYHVWYDNIVLATERVGMVNLQGADPDWRDPSTLPDPTEPVEELQPVIVSGLATEVARGASQQFSACYLPEEDQSASSLSRSLYVTTNLPEQRDYKLTINTALTDNDDYPWNDLTSEMLFNGCHGHNMDMGQYWNSSEKVLRVYYDSPYDLARTKEYLKFFGFNPFRYGDIYDTNLRPEFVIPITKWDENNGWFELSYAEVLAHVGKANLNAGSSPLNDAYNLTGPNLGRYQFAISIYNPDGDFTIGDLPVLPKDMRLEYAAIAPEPIVWFVEGNYSANTTISNTGLLTVGADETAEELTVKAALMSDFTVFGTFELTVVDAPEVPVDKSALESLLYDEDDGAFAFADAACAMYPGVVPASAEYAMFLGAIADAEMVFNSDDATQDDIDAAYDALYEALAAFEAWVGGIVIEVKLTNVSNAKYVSIIETSKNSRVWELTFTVTLSYSDGSSKQAKYTISLNGNNANLDGKYVFGAGHDLGGYTLVYDIKGNGSNIKDFRIIR